MNFRVCVVLALCALASSDQDVVRKTDKRALFGLGYGYPGLPAPIVAPALYPRPYLPYHAPRPYIPAHHGPYAPLAVAASPYNLGYHGHGYSGLARPGYHGYSGHVGLGYNGYSGIAGLGYHGYAGHGY